MPAPIKGNKAWQALGEPGEDDEFKPLLTTMTVRVTHEQRETVRVLARKLGVSTADAIRLGLLMLIRDEGGKAAVRVSPRLPKPGRRRAPPARPLQP